ncbi:MAG: hypothetical protein PVJ80_06465 [Gemmatimonadota bacterium]
MTESRQSTTTGDVLTLLAFFVVGTPMVYVVWHSFSDLLRGIVDPVGLGLSAPLAIVFVLMARYLGSRILRLAGLEAAPELPKTPEPPDRMESPR